jgi:DNA-binding transcriptional MocR family regulator
MASRTVSARSIVAMLGPAEAGVPAYQSLAERLRRLVADGRILRGTRLPSERELTAALGVSRTTVTRAYEVLREAGYLVSRRGSGSVASVPGGRPATGGPLRTGDERDGWLDLTCAAPAALPGTAEAYEAAARELPRHLTSTGYDPYGLPELRAAIADRFTARGLPTSPEQVMVTSGSLAALGIVTRAYLGPGDRVLMESPTYPNAIAALRRSGVRPVGLPLEADGWDVEALEIALRQSAPRAAYLVPDFQNPTGRQMPERTREQVGAALRRARTLPVVDETVAEIALDAEPLRPLAAQDPRAVTVGGANKLFWGGLRLGWLRAPLDQLEPLLEARLTLDLGTPLLEQLVLLRLLAELDTALPARLAALRASREALVGALRERLPDWRFALPPGGLCLWCELPAPRSSALVAAAAQEGVLLAPGGQFGVDGGLESFVRVPYTLPPDQLVEAVSLLAVAWDRAAQSTGPVVRRSPLVA